MRPERSLILEVGIRSVFHTVLLISLYLLFAGHNAPGGGFVGGLVAGAAFVLRGVGTSFSPSGRTRLRPESILGAGLAVAVMTGLASVLVGAELLESGEITVNVPWFDAVKATSALAFDVGVYLIVVGVVLTIVHRLGEEPER